MILMKPNGISLSGYIYTFVHFAERMFKEKDLQKSESLDRPWKGSALEMPVVLAGKSHIIRTMKGNGLMSSRIKLFMGLEGIKWAILVACNLSQVSAQLGIFPSISIGQIENQVSYGKNDKEWIYEIGARGRYLLNKVYLGGDVGLGLFDKEFASTAWVDMGITTHVFSEKVRGNLGVGMAYSGFVVSKYASSNSFEKTYDNNISPFIAVDYEFQKLLIRLQYQPQSEYETRVEIGLMAF
jgi:hypothetical protein